MSASAVNSRTARAILANSRLFAALPEAALATLSSKLKAEHISAGTVVVHAGEEADRYYLIAAGEADVVNAEGRALARLGPTEGFGEMAILYGTRRNATVRAATELELFSLDRDTFLTANQHRGLSLAFEEEMVLRSTVTTLSGFSPFRGLESRSLRWLALHIKRVRYPSGAEIIREGEEGDAVYIVELGRVEVVTPKGGSLRQLAMLGQGEAFGEQALLSDEPRAATVRALEDVVLLRLSREDFQSIVEGHQIGDAYFLPLALQRQRPKRIADWQMEPGGAGQSPYYVLKDRRTNQYLKLSEEAVFLWDLMDGEHTVRDLTLAYFHKYKGFALDTVLEVMLQLHHVGFVQIQHLQSDQARVRETKQSAGRLRFPALQFAVIHYFALPKVDLVVTMLHRYVFRPFYSRPAQVVLLLAVIAGGALYIRYLFFAGLPRIPRNSLGLLASIGIAGVFVQIILHELGHAITCKHFGREVHRAGIGWYYFLPVAFVDTSDIWMASRRSRMAVAFAGPYVNLVLGGLATLLIPFSNPSVAALMASFASTGYLLAVVNMDPLMEFDGYYVLMDWLDIPNLRSKALAYLGARIWRAKRTTKDRRTSRILVGYAVLALLYVLFVVYSILSGYHLYVEGLVSHVLPALAAAAFGWLLASLMAWLVLRRAWSDLRKGVAAS
jgi:putative peptide zinc metalloprotease protein